MSWVESLVLALDTAELELERLKAKNAKLRAAKTAGACSNGQKELRGEVAQLRELYEQALRDLQAKQEETERLGGIVNKPGGYRICE